MVSKSKNKEDKSNLLKQLEKNLKKIKNPIMSIEELEAKSKYVSKDNHVTIERNCNATMGKKVPVIKKSQISSNSNVQNLDSKSPL